MSKIQTYIALLRGINVGGYHKVPMADLRKEMKALGYTNVQTLLNSGNIIFDGDRDEEEKIGRKIGRHLENVFGFSIPVLVRTKETFSALYNADPFEDVEVTDDIRLYVSFLKEVPQNQLNLPWISEDESFQIIAIRDKEVCSVLDLSVAKTPKGMDALEQLFGKEITTRNWNTVDRIAKKLG
ncbi:DUF1697 domain-containing protein [Fodinibius sp. Rm-B-1B1-1]|uniref:DUF1697 domain-containing protein n=1 Tax=Fodinibius alkaliphilus TaxID=3140241 RepID=UPI00315AC303